MTTNTNPSIDRLLRLLSTATDEQLLKQLAYAKTAANYSHTTKKNVVAALAGEGHNCNAELRPYEILKVLLDNITPEEFTHIIHRAAGHVPPLPEPKPRPTNDQLADDLMKTLKRGSKAGIWNGHKQ